MADNKDNKTRKSQEKPAAEDKSQEREAASGKRDYTAFLKENVLPAEEPTEEEKARLEEAEEQLKMILEGQSVAINGAIKAAEKIAAFDSTLQKLSDSVLSLPLRDIRDYLTHNAAKMVELAEWLQGERDSVYSFIDSNGKKICELTGADLKELEALKPFIFEIWHDLHRNPDFLKEYPNISLMDLLEPEKDEKGVIDYPIREIIKQARKIDRPAIEVTVPKTTDRATDLVSRSIWKFDELKDGSNQIQWDFPTVPDIGGTVEYALSFSEIEELNKIEGLQGVKISKKLSALDMRLCEEYASLYSKNEFFSINQLAKAMGYKTVNANTYKKLWASLFKLRTANMLLSNASELEAGADYPEFYYDGLFLPFDIGSGHINGKYVKDAIFPLKEPAIISFARKRGQITPIKKAVLNDPDMSMTEREMTIQRYLLDRIIAMKKAKQNREEANKARKKRKKELLEPQPYETRIKLETFYQECKIPNKSQERARDSAKNRLNHFKNENFIADFKFRGKEYIEIILA